LKFIECSWYLGVSGNNGKAIPAGRVDALRQSADILEAKADFGVGGAVAPMLVRHRHLPAQTGWPEEKMCHVRILRTGSATEMGWVSQAFDPSHSQSPPQEKI
jgi:hypothetical protein